jgi:hypothetical protein
MVDDNAPKAPAPQGSPSPESPGKRGRTIAGVVIIAALAVAIVAMRWRRTEAARAGLATDDHRRGMESTGAVYLAALHAPEGSTPCESSYNALEAIQRATDENHLPRRFAETPPRETFLPICESLGSADQQCLVPRYRVLHRDECEKLGDKMRTTEAGRKLVAWLVPEEADAGAAGGSAP